MSQKKIHDRNNHNMLLQRGLVAQTQVAARNKQKLDETQRALETQSQELQQWKEQASHLDLQLNELQNLVTKKDGEYVAAKVRPSRRRCTVLSLTTAARRSCWPPLRRKMLKGRKPWSVIYSAVVGNLYFAILIKRTGKSAAGISNDATAACNADGEVTFAIDDSVQGCRGTSR